MTSSMFSTHQPLILASASPRRHDFLRNLGLEFSVITARVEEVPLPEELPENFAERMARDKALTIAAAHPSSWVIGADTVVSLADGTILGKPQDRDEALDMLTLLNNATHRVMTGLCLCCQAKQVQTTLVETTEVTFMNNPELLLKAYVASGESLDKAGSYGIQGSGGCLIESVAGSCSNVIGLPVHRLVALLITHQVIGPRR